MRVDSVELTALYQRRQHCPVLCAGLMTSKESILSIECNGSDCALYGIIVQFNATVLEEQAEAVPVFGNVFERLSEWGFG